MRTLNRVDLHDILHGCVILGCGGGGSLDRGLAMVDSALDAGRVFHLADMDDIKDGDRIATPYYCGAVSPDTEESRAKYGGLPVLGVEPALEATRRLEEFMGRGIDGVISTELGGGNTAVAMYVGAMTGKYIVDGDPAGRSVPELQHSTYYINDVPIAPISVVNQFGESAVLTSVTDDFRAEALVRALAVASNNRIAVVDHPMAGSSIKKSVIRGAISYALSIGRAWRGAREAGGDAPAAVAGSGAGRVFFSGRLESFEWDTVDGFTEGYLDMADDAGRKLKVWFKNEHIVSWLDEKPFITVPDLICLFEKDTGRPLTNPYYELGMSIVAVALPSPEEWTTERGLAVLGPRSFGFDFDWRPFEKLL